MVIYSAKNVDKCECLFCITLLTPHGWRAKCLNNIHKNAEGEYPFLSEIKHPCEEKREEW